MLTCCSVKARRSVQNSNEEKPQRLSGHLRLNPEKTPIRLAHTNSFVGGLDVQRKCRKRSRAAAQGKAAANRLQAGKGVRLVNHASRVGIADAAVHQARFTSFCLDHIHAAHGQLIPPSILGIRKAGNFLNVAFLPTKQVQLPVLVAKPNLQVLIRRRYTARGKHVGSCKTSWNTVQQSRPKRRILVTNCCTQGSESRRQ